MMLFLFSKKCVQEIQYHFSSPSVCLCCTFLAELCRINEHQKVALDLDPYVKKLLNARRRVVLVNNILQNAQVCGSSVQSTKSYLD